MPEMDFWEGFDELFEDFFDTKRIRASKVYKPPVNLFEDMEGYVVQVSLAGASKKDISVEFKDNWLIIKGERKDTRGEGPKKYHALEIHFGPFERRIFVNDDIDVRGINTSYKNGLLVIRLPKKRKRVIEVKIEEE